MSLETSGPGTTVPAPPADVAAATQVLRDAVGASVHLPDDPSYDTLRTPWNLAVDQRPAAVAVPESADEVVTVVRLCADLGLRVAPQSTGHGSAALSQHDLDRVVLLRTDRLRWVRVDAERQVASVGGGTVWDDVVTAAGEHGLAALHGSSPNVGVAGYSLGGGIGWYARKLGLATNSVLAVELVTADGTVVRVDADHRPDLFWAVRGGGGSFGVVTALDVRLYPVKDAYAGMMMWDLTQAEPVLRHWARWSQTAPEEVTTALRLMRFPPVPEVPDFLQGRQIIVLDGAFLGDDAAAVDLFAGFRALSPELDTFGRMPAPAIARLHMDPEDPTPGVGNGLVLGSLGDDTIDALLRVAGPGAETALLAAELRQLGGALARRDPDGGVVDHLPGTHFLFMDAFAVTPEMAAAGAASIAVTAEALEPWSNGRSYLNLVEGPADVATAYDADAYDRLRRIRAAVDPHGVFLANHEVPGAAR